MLDQIRAAINHVFGYDALTEEHQQFRAQMTDLERRQLDLEALTTELDARVQIIEGEYADEVGHDALA